MRHIAHPTGGTLAVPGAKLYYEVRGTGPALAVIGSPMAAGEFAALADALADGRTVITYDPRGISGSPVDDPAQDSTPELRADDVVALLDAVGAQTADVFGSSGGAVTGLALAVRYPDRIRTLVAHEPPLLELLPDAAAQRAKTDDVIETFHRQGVGAAWMKFMANAGFDTGRQGAPRPPGEPPEQDAGAAGSPASNLANSARFFDHELRPTTRYLPDTHAMRSGPIPGRRRHRRRFDPPAHLPNIPRARRTARSTVHRISRRPRRVPHLDERVRGPTGRGASRQLAGCSSCQVMGWPLGIVAGVGSGVGFLDRVGVCCWGCRAPTLMYATSTVGGSSGVVRAAVRAKGRVPS